MAPSCTRYAVLGVAMLLSPAFALPLPVPGGAAVSAAQQSSDSGRAGVGGADRFAPLRSAVVGSYAVPGEEIRALWVVRDALRSAASIDRMVDFAVQARFTALFVQVRGRAETYYRSAIDPPAADLEFPVEDFDPLEYLVTLARRHGLAVHAWVNVLYAWSSPDRAPPARHVVRLHPGWFLSDPSGERMTKRDVRWWQNDGIEGYYLDPSRREVRNYLAAVCRELVQNYRVDGVHLDYIRYPARRFTLDVEGRTRFSLRWGIDPARVTVERDELEAAIGAELLTGLDSVVTETRVAMVDSVVAAIREATAGKILSAAVHPDPDGARYEKGQDWPRWVYRGYVDFVVPMMYNDTPHEATARFRALVRTVGRQHVVPGVALHDGRMGGVAELVGALRDAGAPGAVLFSYNVLSDMKFPVRVTDRVFFSGGPSGP